MQVPVGLSLAATTNISAPNKAATASPQGVPRLRGGGGWRQLVQRAMAELDQVVKLEQKINVIDGKVRQLSDPSLRQGLQLQLTAQDLGLRMELYTKCLDGVAGAIKRLQQPS